MTAEMATDAFLADSAHFKLKGIMRLEVRSADGVTKKVYENTVTDIGLLAMLAQSAGRLMTRPAAIGFGEWLLSSGFSYANRYGVTDDATDSGGQQPSPLYNWNKEVGGLTAYLLNVPSTTTLSSSSTFLPVYNSSFNFVAANVIGYANVDRQVASTNTLNGVATTIASNVWTDDTGAYAQWEFPLSQANGTFNTVAIGANVMNNRYAGFALFKGINPSDYANNSGANSPIYPAFFPPNLGSLTGASTLLGCLDGSGTVSSSFDLDTGVWTTLASGALGKGIPLPAAGSAVVYDSTTTSAYYLGSVSGGYATLYAVNTSTGAVTTLASSITVGEDPLSVFLYNGYIYVPSNAQTHFTAYTTGGVATSSANLPISSLNLPSDFAPSTTTLTTQNTYVMGPTPTNFHVSGPNGAITVTNIVACSTTIVDILCGYPLASVYAEGTSGKDMGILSTIFPDDGVLMHVGDGSATATFLANVPYPVISRGYHGNMISFVTLSAAQTKTSSDIVTLTYGYQFT